MAIQYVDPHSTVLQESKRENAEGLARSSEANFARISLTAFSLSKLTIAIQSHEAVVVVPRQRDVSINFLFLFPRSLGM